jgi:type IV secretory pathway VirB10-like protein
MRSAGNFHPEWGYLAPAPRFMRTVRIALVATAIGATAGAVVVVSLVERPGPDANTTSIAAHALVTAAPVVTAPAPALAKSSAASGQTPASVSAPAGGVVSASKPVSSPGAAASVAALDETSPAAAAANAPAESESAEKSDSADRSEAVAAQKPQSKRHHAAPYEAARRWQSESDARKRWRDNRGFAPLLRLFSFRTGSSDYSN